MPKKQELRGGEDVIWEKSLGKVFNELTTIYAYADFLVFPTVSPIGDSVEKFDN